MARSAPLSNRRAACLLALAVALVAAAPPRPARAQAPAGEAEAKARFTLTFARFVQWPAPAPAGTAPLRLCVLHDSPAVAAAFGLQQGALVGGRSLSVQLNPADSARGCDLVFVDGSAPRAALGLLGEPHGGATLTLGAVDGFLSRGGMVELVNVDDALRFDVNLKALRSAQLGLSAQVLKLARQVRE